MARPAPDAAEPYADRPLAPPARTAPPESTPPESAPANAPAAPPAPMPPARAAAYMAAALALALTQGMGMNMVSANVQQLQGVFGATSAETSWLVAAYMAPNVSLALALIKLRTQFGLRTFAEGAILVFVGAALLNHATAGLGPALVTRFLSGVAAAPMSSLAFLYMLEPFPPQRKLTTGLPLALTAIALGAPLARVVSPPLLDLGLWHALTALELGLALIALACVYLLPLTSPPRAKVIHWLDVTSYLLIATGFGAIAVSLVLGPIYWWVEAPWIGWLLVLAAAALAAAAMIELNRPEPLLDIRWLASPAVLHFTAALLVFRLVLSEQSSGAAGLFRAMGYGGAQSQALFAVIAAATLAGGLLCALLLRPGREPAIHVVALLLVASGAFLDSHATTLTRPANMYLSQSLIALGMALFLPPALMSGLTSALRKGPQYILSFIIVFLTTQSLGGLAGSAAFQTFVTWRQRLHLGALAEQLDPGNPLVAERLASLTASYGAVLPDQGALSAQGLALLNAQVTAQAQVLAYDDAFRAIALIALAALAALLLHIGGAALLARRAPAPSR